MSSEISLRLVCHLQLSELEKNELEYFTHNERMGRNGWVDADRPRDEPWTVLVASKSDKFGVADEDGVLAEFPTFAEANTALTRAASEMGAVLESLKTKVKRTAFTTKDAE